MSPVSPLRITTYERSLEQLKAQEEFHSRLRNTFKTRLQWYEIEAPDPEAGAIIYRDNVKNGRGGWVKPIISDTSPTYVSISSKTGNASVRARLFSPPSDRCAPKQGVLMHIHGGGWVFGDPDNEEVELSRLAQLTGYTVASVVYRLAPKHPYPAAIEDCLEAALFFLSKPIEQQYGKLRAMGGDSAGAHLSMCLLFALRKLGVDLRSQFDGIFLYYGVYGKC
jgi:acetyl esterase/lipase